MKLMTTSLALFFALSASAVLAEEAAKETIPAEHAIEVPHHTGEAHHKHHRTHHPKHHHKGHKAHEVESVKPADPIHEPLSTQSEPSEKVEKKVIETTTETETKAE